MSILIRKVIGRERVPVWMSMHDMTRPMSNAPVLQMHQHGQTFPRLGSGERMAVISPVPSPEIDRVQKISTVAILPDDYGLRLLPTESSYQNELIYLLPLCSFVNQKHDEILGCWCVSIRVPDPPNPRSSVHGFIASSSFQVASFRSVTKPYMSWQTGNKFKIANKENKNYKASVIIQEKLSLGH